MFYPYATNTHKDRIHCIGRAALNRKIDREFAFRCPVAADRLNNPRNNLPEPSYFDFLLLHCGERATSELRSCMCVCVCTCEKKWGYWSAEPFHALADWLCIAKTSGFVRSPSLFSIWHYLDTPCFQLKLLFVESFRVSNRTLENLRRFFIWDKGMLPWCARCTCIDGHGNKSLYHLIDSPLIQDQLLQQLTMNYSLTQQTQQRLWRCDVVKKISSFIAPLTAALHTQSRAHCCLHFIANGNLLHVLCG